MGLRPIVGPWYMTMVYSWSITQIEGNLKPGCDQQASSSSGVLFNVHCGEAGKDKWLKLQNPIIDFEQF